MVIEAIDENHCRHRVEGEVHSDAHFGIGKLAEHMVIDSTVKTVERLPEITERCVAGTHSSDSSERLCHCEHHAPPLKEAWGAIVSAALQSQLVALSGCWV